jgi:hypothetical protein
LEAQRAHLAAHCLVDLGASVGFGVRLSSAVADKTCPA